MICDPLECEEESADASLIIAANAYREVVALHCSGQPVIDSEKVIKCSRIAIERVKYLTEYLKKSLEIDKENRAKSIDSVGFANAIRTGIMSAIQPDLNLLDVIKVDQIEEEEPMDRTDEQMETQNIYFYGRGTASIGDGGPSKWTFNAPVVDSDGSNDEIFPLEIGSNKIKSKSDDEEEEEVMILNVN